MASEVNTVMILVTGIVASGITQDMTNAGNIALEWRKILWRKRFFVEKTTWRYLFLSSPYSLCGDITLFCSFHIGFRCQSPVRGLDLNSLGESFLSVTRSYAVVGRNPCILANTTIAATNLRSSPHSHYSKPRYETSTIYFHRSCPFGKYGIPIHIIHISSISIHN